MQNCYKGPQLRGVGVWRSNLSKVIASPVDIKAAMRAIAAKRMSRKGWVAVVASEDGRKRGC